MFTKVINGMTHVLPALFPATSPHLSSFGTGLHIAINCSNTLKQRTLCTILQVSVTRKLGVLPAQAQTVDKTQGKTQTQTPFLDTYNLLYSSYD